MQFEPIPEGGRSKAYFGLWFGLEDLYQRHVDLVQTSAISNPYFLETITKSREVVYAG